MEIDGGRYDWLCRIAVTTCVVVWIEIDGKALEGVATESPPAWWCGLKLEKALTYNFTFRHHLRGGVD